MECPTCKSSNPGGKRFCGDCGARLTPDDPTNADLRRLVKGILEKDLKDQNVVEVEIAESIANRVIGWAKLLTYVVGIPVALVLLTLGGFGISKISDLKELSTAAELRIKSLDMDAEGKQQKLKELEPKIAAIEAADKRVSELETDLNHKVTESQRAFEDKIANLEKEFENRVSGVQGEVDQIKKAIDFVGKAFTPVEFREYVSGVQFTSWKPEFIVLHNTSDPTLEQWHKLSSRTALQKFAEYYGGMGWSGGPHLFVDDKTIWVFNPLNKPGVHAASWNKISLGVMMIGDYDTEAFDDNVRNNTVQAIAILDEALKLKAETLRFHRDEPNATHSCPGKNVVKEDIIRRISTSLVALKK
jgi:hypothetical protein